MVFVNNIPQISPPCHNKKGLTKYLIILIMGVIFLKNFKSQSPKFSCISIIICVKFLVLIVEILPADRNLNYLKVYI